MSPLFLYKGIILLIHHSSGTIPACNTKLKSFVNTLIIESQEDFKNSFNT